MDVNPGDGLIVQETVDGISGVGQMKSETNVVPYEFYIDGEPGTTAQAVTWLELAIAVRCARAFRPGLVYRYRHTKKKRIRKKYAKRILIWYWEVLQ